MSSLDSQIVAEIPALRRFARALVRDAAEADDLVQDCLERALSRAAQWRRDTALRPWLFTILRHLWLDGLRRRRTRPEGGSPDGMEAAGGLPPSQTARLMVRDLAAALDMLVPEQREVVLMVGLEGMSYAEVAQVTGVPLGTVMSRLKRGRDRLALLMQGAEPTIRRVK